MGKYFLLSAVDVHKKFNSPTGHSCSIFHKWKSTVRQNEGLKNQHIHTKFEVLRNQMSPYSLLNSLNTLTTLPADTSIDAMHRLT